MVFTVDMRQGEIGQFSFVVFIIYRENDDIVLPNSTVYDLYERFFGLERNRKSIYMRLLRKDGSRLNHLYQELL